MINKSASHSKKETQLEKTEGKKNKDSLIVLPPKKVKSKPCESGILLAQFPVNFRYLPCLS